MFIKDWKKDVFTIPNMLSIFRLVLIPVYMRIYLKADAPKDHILAASILAVSCLTDALDGMIARRLHMVTQLGKVLDPLADKATQFTLILSLSLRYPLLQYLLGIFIIKELFQLLMGLIYLHRGKILSGALVPGKICTAVLFISLILLVLIPQLSEAAAAAIMLVDLLFLSWSFCAYFLAYCGRRPDVQDLKF